MKSKFLFTLFALVLASCTTADPTVATQIPTVASVTAEAGKATITPTFTITPTVSTTKFSSQTYSATPTFDRSHIRTATPDAPESCSAAETGATPPALDLTSIFTDPGNRTATITKYLNTYGIEAVIKTTPTDTFSFVDLTNDGTPELILEDFFSILIIGCQEGSYNTLFEIKHDTPTPPGRIETIADVNRDGIPEIAINGGYASQGGHAYAVYEWDGKQFRNLITDPSPGLPQATFIQVEATGSIAFSDIDGDGLQELIVHSGVPVGGEIYRDFGPWRNVTSIYKWNGSQYVFSREDWDSPEYRFQAVQDGDRHFLAGEYDRALAMYQQAITNDKLKWWSQEIPHYMLLVEDAKYYQYTLPAPPVEDKNEYIALSAYSYFRIMLIYLITGQDATARDIYKLIETHYINYPYGQAYAKMTAAFWDEYSARQNIVSACKKAIDYTELHQNELLPYLGNTVNTLDSAIFHGEQSLEYESEAICPFK